MPPWPARTASAAELLTARVAAPVMTNLNRISFTLLNPGRGCPPPFPHRPRLIGHCDDVPIAERAGLTLGPVLGCKRVTACSQTGHNISRAHPESHLARHLYRGCVRGRYRPYGEAQVASLVVVAVDHGCGNGHHRPPRSGNVGSYARTHGG